MALVELRAQKIVCSNCRKNGEQAGELICRCGQTMRSFAKAIRWICISCGNSIPMPRCDCYLLYDIEVNGVLTSLGHSAT